MGDTINMAVNSQRLGVCLGNTYDILTQVISVLDVVTDIWVCITFRQEDRNIFFAISLSILVMALLSYSFAFVKYFDGGWDNANAVLLFFLILPFSPILPFAFHYPDTTESIFDCFGICGANVAYQMKKSKTDTASKFKQFFEEKIEKHMGFILESLIEAFPQAILQMAAIVIYKEPNTIAIISIFISLLSVASKSLVFMMGVSNSIKELFFYWLCAVTDFFGMFFVVCWVFYEPQDESL